jgi:N-acetylglucosaminyldiphosphoundecaprenol N-acetyl-beta-D-mannosaminyltransferase
MEKVELFGCPVDNLSLSDTVKRIEYIIREGEPKRHCALNAAKVVKMHKDERLREIVSTSDVVNADGQSIVWASSLLKRPLPERVAGIDLMQKLLELAESRGYRVFLLGGTEEVIQELKVNLKRKHPKLRLVGWRNGYFKAGEEAELVREIKERSPDILFVGMSTPKKEYFIAKYQTTLKVPFLMGVGGSFDVLCGRIRRAPHFMQQMGLEWLYRFLQEPTRMWKRYLVTNILFLFYLLRERFANNHLNKAQSN